MYIKNDVQTSHVVEKLRYSNMFKLITVNNNNQKKHTWTQVQIKTKLFYK